MALEQETVTPKPDRAPGLRTLAVVNPASASGATRTRWQDIETHLRINLSDFDVAFTRKPGHATELTQDALRRGFNQIVAVGGDGTVNEVVNGFFDGDQAISPQAVLGIIAQGTGCDFVKTAYAENSLEAACARLAGFRSRTMDLGKVTFRTEDGGTDSRLFINVMSMGIGGKVARGIKYSKILGGKLGYKLVSFRTLLAYRDQTLRVTIDDGETVTWPVTNLAVANARFHGGGMMVAPNAKPDDGLFDITLWQGFGIFDFLLRQRKIYDGSHVEMNGSSHRLGQKLHAESDERVMIEVDGEVPGELPVTVEIMPAAIRLKI